MEAKDTVMDNLAQAIIAHPDLPMGQAIAIEQAEVSFKAGQEAERAFILQNTDRDKRTRLEGRKEVVEWIAKYRTETTREFIGFTFTRAEWEAKVKEWGL